MGFGPDELRTYAFLSVLLDSFRKVAFDYCAEGDTPEARFERVKEIRKALTGDGPSPNVITSVSVLYGGGCPPGQHCEGGACVPDDVYTGWPKEGDPPAWNE
jgi:hypothetical protein